MKLNITNKNKNCELCFKAANVFIYQELLESLKSVVSFTSRTGKKYKARIIVSGLKVIFEIWWLSTSKGNKASHVLECF